MGFSLEADRSFLASGGEEGTADRCSKVASMGRVGRSPEVGSCMEIYFEQHFQMGGERRTERYIKHR
jgi:hypothetical protein